MKTLLVPVDFSSPCNNAVSFAADLSNDRDFKQIILLTNFYKPVFETYFPSADFVQDSDETLRSQKDEIKKQLEGLKQEMLTKVDADIQIKTILTETPLLRSIVETIEKEHPDILLLGSNSAAAPCESFFAEHLIEITKASPIPVLVVPPKSEYQKLKTVLVPCDFRSLHHVSVLQRLEKIKTLHHPEIALLNVGSSDKPKEEIDKAVKELMKDFDYKLYHLDGKNVLKSIISFADQQHLQMIIALPGRHSFLYSLTHQSITTGLSVNAQKPVLILK